MGFDFYNDPKNFGPRNHRRGMSPPRCKNCDTLYPPLEFKSGEPIIMPKCSFCETEMEPPKYLPRCKKCNSLYPFPIYKPGEAPIMPKCPNCQTEMEPPKGPKCQKCGAPIQRLTREERSERMKLYMSGKNPEPRKCKQCGEELNKLEEKSKNFENKYNNAEDAIKGLKLKVAQLNKKIEEMKGEIDSIKIRNKTINESNIEGSLNLNNLNINKNIVEHYNKTMEKNSMDRINIIGNSKINIHLRQGLTNNNSPSNNLNIESAKNNQIKALSANTIDHINNRLIISNSNKIYSNNSKIKNIIAPLRNNQIQNAKKLKSSSVSKRSDESEKSELTSKYLSVNNNLKYGPHTKIRSLNRINNRINNTGYLLPKANSNFNIKYIQRDERIPYEHSALNLIGIKEFK
jgi:hypothetical protein